MQKLYKRNKNGSIQHWSIEVREEPHSECYITEYGQVGGKTTTSAPTYTSSKNVGRANEKTALTVAQEYAAKKYKDKLESGFFVSVEGLPKNTQVIFKPTLAEKYDEKTLEKNVLISPKLDGLRCIVSKDGSFSRSNKKFATTLHIESSLKTFFEDYPNIRLDGELYNHKYKDNFNKIISLARKTNPTEDNLIEAAEKLEYHIFDMYDADSESATSQERIEFLTQVFSRNGISSPCVLVATVQSVFEGVEQIEIAHAAHTESGYEGSMIRNASSTYEFTRTKNLQKYKAFEDDEFIITDITEGVGKRAGMMGRIHAQTKDGIEFGSGARGSESFYKELFANKEKYIGKLATIRYQNLTPDGIPRFPVMVMVDRPDIEKCT